MIKAKLTGTSGAINSQLDSNEQQLEASLEKSTTQYVGGNGINIDNGTISNTGVTSINGQTGDLDGFALSAEIPTKTSQLENDSNYANANQIPTKTSQLVNDSNYATYDEIPTDYYTQEEVNTLISNVTVDLSDYYTKTESDDKFADKSDVPTNTSQLTNDSQFITNTVSNLTNYYKKTETYTQTEVNNLIGSITTISFQVVDNLQSTGEANIIYLVSDAQSTNNVYDEYIWVNNSWELIGSTSVDLSNYYTKTEADNKFALSANLADVATSGSYNDLTNKPNYAGANSEGGSANSAVKLTTARTIDLSDGVEADANSFDGTANISIPVTSIKEAYLTWGGKNLKDSYSPIDAAMIPDLGANRFAYAKAASITIEYTQDGSTWIDYGASDTQKLKLTTTGTTLIVGKPDSTTQPTSNFKLRITFTTSTAQIYTILNKFAIYCSTNYSTDCTCKIQTATHAAPTTFVDKTDKIPISGWPGWNIINTSSIATYGYFSHQYEKVRFLFEIGGHTANKPGVGLKIQKIFAYGGVGWNAPSNLARYGTIYSTDYNQNVTFPATVSASLLKSNGQEVATTNEIPTKTSDLINDSGFITAEDIPSGAVLSVNNKTGNVVLSASDVGALPDTTTIPTTTSQLTNDSGYITNATDGLTNYYNKTEVDNKITSVYKYKGTVASYALLPTTGQVVGDVYNILDSDMNYAWTGESWDALGSSIDLSDYYTKTETDNKFALSEDLPTKTSDLTNDSGFITNSVDNLTNYYDKDTTDENVTKAKDELLSMGEQLVINGSALMGDNTNFSSFAFDGSQANGSAGSFTKSGSSTTGAANDKLISLNPAYKYVFEIDAKTLNGISKTYTYIDYKDIDKNTIMTKNTAYFENTLTTLSQDLNNGDTIVHLTDLTNWNVNTGNANYYRGFIFWNYKNSYGYQYPAETYSRNEWFSLYVDTNVDKTNNTITLTNAWNHGTITAGTQLSQHKGLSAYFYAGIRGNQVPQQWTHYKSIIDSIPAGTAFAKLGFMLFYNNTASDQIWFTNISLRRAIESSEVVGLSDEIPTKTSDLTNDNEYQTATQVTAAITSAIGTTSNLLGDTEDLS